MLKRFLSGFFCVFLMLTQFGCLFVVGSGLGAGAAIWYKGRLTQHLNEDMDTVYQASIMGIKKMGLPILKAKKDQDVAQVRSKYLDDTYIWITIEALSPYSSEITIRVGVLGDEQRARQILKEILSRI
ncbi:DUF3568 family protein [Desulfovulcanus sp.]